MLEAENDLKHETTPLNMWKTLNLWVWAAQLTTSWETSHPAVVPSFILSIPILNNHNFFIPNLFLLSLCAREGIDNTIILSNCF